MYAKSFENWLDMGKYLSWIWDRLLCWNSSSASFASACLLAPFFNDLSSFINASKMTIKIFYMKGPRIDDDDDLGRRKREQQWALHQK